MMVLVLWSWAWLLLCIHDVTSLYSGLSRPRQGSKVLLLTSSRSNDLPDSWSKDHQTPIINRALDEERLMNEDGHTQTVLKAVNEAAANAYFKANAKKNKATKKRQDRGKGGGGGFGFGASSISTTSKKKGDENFGLSTSSPYKEELQSQGVLRLDAVLSESVTTPLLRYINQHKEVANPTEFANVLLSDQRYDLLLPVTSPEVKAALREALVETKELSNLLASCLASPPQLHELACLISDPGSKRQVIHPDVPCQSSSTSSQQEDTSLITCFFALQDIEEDMGPTVFLPGTNTVDHHNRLNDHSQRDDLIVENGSVRGLLKRGDVSVFDGQCLHAGTANTSEKRRVLFYFSFRSARFNPGTSNNPGSLLPEVDAQKWKLHELMEFVSQDVT